MVQKQFTVILQVLLIVCVIIRREDIISLHGATDRSDYTSPSVNFSYTDIDKWALAAHYGVAAAYTFYKNNSNESILW
ncbi:MAG: hypothetical protein WKG06_18805 [Segetibacter sp.]